MTTIREIKEHNAKMGHHFFSPDTMRFFNSKVEERVYEGPGGIYFVTSEQGPHTGRLFTIRKYIPETGHCITARDFQKFETSREAHEQAKELAEELSLE